MKIIYMAHRYHTNQSAIMKGWIENGHEVRFISQYAGKIEDYSCVKPVIAGYSKIYRLFDYVYVHFLKRNDPYAIDKKLKCGFPPIFKLAHYIREFDPDVAILRERSIYTICMNLICRHYKIPAILYNQTPLWDKPQKMDLPHQIVWMLTPKYRITPVELVGTDRSGLVEDEKGIFVPFVMEPKVSPEEKKYFLNENINIFCVGKYQERKNHQMMIEVIEELLTEYQLHLTIAGEISNHFHEEYYKKLVDYIKTHNLEHKVTLLINLNRDSMYEEYRKADVCVLPSTGEPASYTILEAMAFSLPAISGSDNGTASYIETGRTGYVFEDNNKKDLKDKLEKIICDRAKLVRMGAAGYQHLKESFQFQNYYEQVTAVIEKIGKE